MLVLVGGAHQVGGAKIARVGEKSGCTLSQTKVRRLCVLPLRRRRHAMPPGCGAVRACSASGGVRPDRACLCAASALCRDARASDCSAARNMLAIVCAACCCMCACARAPRVGFGPFRSRKPARACLCAASALCRDARASIGGRITPFASQAFAGILIAKGRCRRHVDATNAHDKRADLSFLSSQRL